MHNHWDVEARHLASEVQSLSLAAQALQQRADAGIPSHKLNLVKQQAQLFQALEKIKSIMIPPALLNLRLHSLLHWCQQYGQQLTDFYEAEVKLLGKRMWLGLVQVRVSGAHGSQGQGLTEDDLIDMAVRHSNLAKTEKYLSQQLIDLQARKQELQTQYREYELRYANREAAQSLYGSFGQNSREALDHPVMHGLSRLMQQLTWPFRLSSSENKNLQRVQRKILGQADDLMHQCRDGILQTMHSPHRNAGGTYRQKAHSSINEIERLKTDFLHQSTVAAQRAAPPARPILMKSKSNQARTL